MPAKEELTQQERDKLEINPDFDFKEIAKRLLSDLTPNEIAMFKWSGIYNQLQPGFFMVRLRVPGGIMTAEQLRRAGDLAETYAREELCITTRQTLQFHWIRLQDIYRILDGMAEVGVSTRNAAGNVTRNVVGCPLIGVCPHEIGEAREMMQKIADNEQLLDTYRNFPRKHKISVSGCGRSCGQTLMNCQGWHPVVRECDGVQEIWWRLYSGGGLGARPYTAKRIFDWVPSTLVEQVVLAGAEAFHRHGNRRNRSLARLKLVVERLGAAGYADVVLGILEEWGGRGLDAIEKATEAPALEESFLDGQAVIPQKQSGMNSVRVRVPRGELSSQQIRLAADLSEQYGNGTVIFTNRQNFNFLFVPDDRVDALLQALADGPWVLEGFERVPDTVACVGTAVCNFAVSDTPATYRAIVAELSGDRSWWDKIGPLRINMNGCPNGCGQHAIADIGLRGARKRELFGSNEGFSIYVGGALDGTGHLGQFACDVAASDVVPTLRRILNLYLAEREDAGESFSAYARRVTGAGVAERLGRQQAEGEALNMRNLELQEVFAVDGSRTDGR